MASSIKEAVKLHMPPGIQIIAEPGRFYARNAYTLVCKVISRRRQMSSNKSSASNPDMLYQNDGVYGNFMNVMIEKEAMCPSLVVPALSLTACRANLSREEGEHWYSIWGPTCDSVDCVTRQIRLNSEIKVGDWLMYKNMGGESGQRDKCTLTDTCSVYHGHIHTVQRVWGRASGHIYQQRVADRWRRENAIVHPIRRTVWSAGDCIVFNVIARLCRIIFFI